MLPRALSRFGIGTASLQCLQPERDAKAELNRRNQACEVLADTGIRIARNGRAYEIQSLEFKMQNPELRKFCILHSEFSIELSPCWNRTSPAGAHRRQP